MCPNLNIEVKIRTLEIHFWRMRTQFNFLAIIYNTIIYLNYAFKVDIYLTQQYWIDISVYISLSAILNRYICVLCHRGFVKNYLFHSSGYWQDSGYNNYVTALNFPQYCKILRGYKSFICCIPTNNDKHYTVLFLWKPIFIIHFMGMQHVILREPCQFVWKVSLISQTIF